MHACPNCKENLPRIMALAEGGVMLACGACSNTWTLATVPEPYLRELIARSLELAALKAGALQ